MKVYIVLAVSLFFSSLAHTQEKALTYSNIYLDGELDKSASNGQPYLVYGSDTIALVDGEALGTLSTQEDRKSCLTLFYKGEEFPFGKVRLNVFKYRVDFHLFTPKSEGYYADYGEWPRGKVRFVYFYTTTINLSLEEIDKGASEGTLYSILESKHKKLKN